MPVSATPFYGREAPAVPSLARVDGLLPSALVEEVMIVWEEMVRGETHIREMQEVV